MTEPVTPLVTDAEFAAHLTGTDRNELALAAAIQAVEDYCGWHVAPVRVDTVTVDADGSGVVFLPTLRILEILSVAVDGVAVPLGSVRWSADGYLLVSGAGLRRVTVEMRHGFDASASLKQAVLSLAASARASSDGRTVTSYRVDAVATTYAADAGSPGAGGAVFGSPYTTLDRYRLNVRP